jgi:hypothetical protein
MVSHWSSIPDRLFVSRTQQQTVASDETLVSSIRMFNHDGNCPLQRTTLFSRNEFRECRADVHLPFQTTITAAFGADTAVDPAWGWPPSTRRYASYP